MTAAEDRPSRGREMRRNLFAVFTIFGGPPIVLLLAVGLSQPDDAAMALLRNPLAWPRPTLAAIAILLAFAAAQAVLMLFLPGREVLGPPTPAGLRMRYKDNGFAAFVVTQALLLVLYTTGLLRPALVIDNYLPLVATLTIAGWLFSALLYVKGRVAPSSADRGVSGNHLFDFFWGIELHPRIGRFDLKLFTIARLAMMGWAAIVVTLLADAAIAGPGISAALFVASALQLAYIARFFWWESGYVATLDIMHDRFGYYLCWGVLAWLPVAYPAAPLYIASHPVDLPPAIAAAILALGAVALLLTHLADAQRQEVRATEGRCLVWGRPPALIRAAYLTASGERREAVLLASGYWGFARHPNYLAEMLLAFAWTLPCGFASPLPYVYPVYLALLLLHRAGRDDRRCRAKYGARWEEYCARVPYILIPGIY